MSKLSKGLNIVSSLLAYLLLGYALAGPLRLSFYFFPKPFWDLLIDVVLIIGMVAVSIKWLKEKFKYVIILIPVIAITWMKMEFLLFSKPAIYEVFSYSFIALWCLCLVATWKYFDNEVVTSKKWSTSLFLILLGGVWGYLDQHYLGVLLLGVLLILVLGISNWKSSSGSNRLVSVAYKVVILAAVYITTITLPLPVVFESQSKFEDKVVFSLETNFQSIDITEWNGNYWFYQDGINQFSSMDSWLYFEPFAHPAMQLVPTDAKVLVIGGENGMLIKELLKYEEVKIDLMPVDEEYLNLSREVPYLTLQNDQVLDDSQVNLLGDDIFRQLDQVAELYDVIFIDVPDPVDIELNQYFSLEFYELCRKALSTSGFLITQSGSPYFATRAFQSIQKTLKAAGYNVEAYHNQILTLGEWAWTIGTKSSNDINLREALYQQGFQNVNTEWLNNEAMQMMLSFGKPYVTSGQVKVNTIQEPVIYQYYIRGNYRLQ